MYKVQLPESQGFETQIKIDTTTHNANVSLAQKF